MIQQTISPLDIIWLSEQPYSKLNVIKADFRKLKEAIDLMELIEPKLCETYRIDREVCRLNNYLVNREIDYRAELVPDWYLDEIKALLQ